MSLVAIPLKHKAPLRCRLNILVFGASVSARFGKCLIGCKRLCKKCGGCENNIPEILAENFKRGVEVGLKHRPEILTKKFNHTGRVPDVEKMEVLNGNTQRQNI